MSTIVVYGTLAGVSALSIGKLAMKASACSNVTFPSPTIASNAAFIVEFVVALLTASIFLLYAVYAVAKPATSAFSTNAFVASINSSASSPRLTFAKSAYRLVPSYFTSNAINAFSTLAASLAVIPSFKLTISSNASNAVFKESTSVGVPSA